jgi:C4-dicarboxylate-specific signal transduction histidine kinase
MNGLINDMVEFSRKMFRKKHVSVVLDLQPKLEQIRGDRIGLQQVLINLITNALEAMRKSSSKNLEIGTTMPSPDKLMVSVGDSGMGVDKTTKDNLFTPFFTTKKDGPGMGLRICREIIEEHGDRIWVENHSQGGATFSFSSTTNQKNSNEYINRSRSHRRRRHIVSQERRAVDPHIGI